MWKKLPKWDKKLYKNPIPRGNIYRWVSSILFVDKLDRALEKIKSEPNRETFTYEGYKCLIVRHPEFGHLCGYVGIPEGHKYYKKHYDDVPLEVHGGLTFSDFWEDENDNLWYLGFDCAHAWDLSPFMHKRDREIYNSQPRSKYWINGVEHEYKERDLGAELMKHETYRDIEYVRIQCKKMVKQLNNPVST